MEQEEGAEVEGETEDVSPVWKKLKAEAGARPWRDDPGTPVQLQASLAHAGRPSLTPLPLPAATPASCCPPLPLPSPVARRSACGRESPAGPAQPKKQLTQWRQSDGVAASRSRLFALLKPEDTAVA